MLEPYPVPKFVVDPERVKAQISDSADLSIRIKRKDLIMPEETISEDKVVTCVCCRNIPTEPIFECECEELFCEKCSLVTFKCPSCTADFGLKKRKMNRKLKALTIDSYKFSHSCQEAPATSEEESLDRKTKVRSSKRLSKQQWKAEQGSSLRTVSKKSAKSAEAKPAEAKLVESKEYSYAELIQHFKEECTDRLYSCPNNCSGCLLQRSFSKEELRIHLMEECPSQKLQCTVCKQEVERRVATSKHSAAKCFAYLKERQRRAEITLERQQEEKRRLQSSRRYTERSRFWEMMFPEEDRPEMMASPATSTFASIFDSSFRNISRDREREREREQREQRERDRARRLERNIDFQPVPNFRSLSLLGRDGNNNGPAPPEGLS